MKLTKAMIFAAAFALPFSVLGAQTALVESVADATVVHEVDGQAPEGYDCCFVYFNGRWYCVNCG